MYSKGKNAIAAGVLVFLAWAYAVPGVWSPTALTGRPGEAASASSVHPQRRLGMAWTSIAVPDSYPKRMGHGCCWDPVHDRIYMYGGEPSGSVYSNLTECECYDPVANRWTSVAPMSTARGWIKGLYARGKVYAISGMSNSGMPLTSCEAYDISTNTWSAIAGIPQWACGYQACVYRDSLIYVCGGDNGMLCGRDKSYGAITNTQIYNILADSWMTGTDMPMASDYCDCDIIGDTIYFLGGMDDEHYVFDTTILKGGINPNDPTKITWSWGPRLPGVWGDTGRCDGPTVALDGKLYGFGGVVGWQFTPDSVGYVFDPGTQSWDTMPAYPTTVGFCCLAAARGNAFEIFALGGELGDTALTGYYRLCVRPFHDAGVTQMIAPAAIVQVADTVTPSAWVKNFGTQTEGFRIMMRIDSEYTDWQDIYVGSLDSLQVSFSPWVAAQGGAHTAKCSTMLADDGNDTNDASTKVFTVSAVAVEQPSSASAPKAFALDVPSPNPSRDAVTIRYALPKAADISLKLYDAAGKQRATLYQGHEAAGRYSATFDIRHSSFDITPGIYFVRLNSPGFEETRKFVMTP